MSTAMQVTGGVDTHADTHHAAALDEVGRLLGDREFPATPAGYAELGSWLAGYGELAVVGVEGTGSYGAGLTLTYAPRARRSWRSTDPTADSAWCEASLTRSTPRTPPGAPWLVATPPSRRTPPQP